MANPNVLKDLGQVLTQVAAHNIGPDLQGLLNDPKFEEVLRKKKFYKQNFDEPFQVLDHAVMLGYKADAESPKEKPRFIVIRFPQELAAALQFHPFGEER